MKLFDPIIERIEGLLGDGKPAEFEYNPGKAWEDAGGNQLVMLKESAFELGGDGRPAVNYSCVTSGEYIDGDSIAVYGKDLSEIEKSTPFARIAIVKVRDLEALAAEKESQEASDESAAADREFLFRAVQDIEFVKYHVYPKGYMIRSSTDSFREQVRVSKEAARKGITFEQVGNAYIRKYKENPNVEAVRMIFVTAEDADYAQMKKDASKVREIMLTLSKILEGMPTDCTSCSLKPICDEVEGMKELHFGKEKKEFKG